MRRQSYFGSAAIWLIASVLASGLQSSKVLIVVQRPHKQRLSEVMGFTFYQMLHGERGVGWGSTCACT